MLPLRQPKFYPRIWGQRDLRAWYPELGLTPEPIGEAWLTTPDDSLLIKMLFPRERLSVQVHPDDAYAAAHGLGRGKTEAWYVVEAEPGAQLGVGLRPGVTWPQFEAACRTGAGADCLHWLSAHPGDVIYIPAGTVHAIGGGMVLCEVQQPSDTTYRLDDYGRGRELHLAQGMAVARHTEGGKVESAGHPLLSTPFFEICRHAITPVWQLPPSPKPRFLVKLDGGTPIWPRGHAVELAPGVSLSSHDLEGSPTTLLEFGG